MKTTQAVRNIRKFKKHQTHGVKGRMITDDYGNRYSTKASGGRRHTLSRAKKRADGLNYEDPLYNARPKSETGHAASVRRRNTTVLAMPSATDKKLSKISYHIARRKGDLKMASAAASRIHGTKRKPKDFTK